MTGGVIGSGMDRRGREGEMEMGCGAGGRGMGGEMDMGCGVIELVGMSGVTVLAVTFGLGILELGSVPVVGLVELDGTLGRGITGLGIGPIGSSSSMIE